MEARAVAGRQDEVRRQVHRMWGGVADAWEEHADYVDARGANVTARMLDVTRPVAGERVVELACGTGSVGIAASPLVGPGGHVVLSDVAPEMTRVAAARASARGLTNVTARQLDVEEIDEPDDAFDVVLCREGLMFAVDPARGAREIARVLRPGGRAAIAVWGPRERNPWLGVVLDVASEQFGAPIPPPGQPGPFALDDAGTLEGLLTGAGFEHVAVDELPVPYRAGAFEEWAARTAALAGPLANRLAALPAETRQQFAGRLRDAVQPYETGAGLEFPGVTLLAHAHV